MKEKDREEIEAFARKMQDEGAAGFAAGLTPWESWDEFEKRVGSRSWHGSENWHRSENVRTRTPSTQKFGDRVLTSMTAVAVAALAIGIAGVYFSTDSMQQLAATDSQNAPQSVTSETNTDREQHVALNESELAEAATGAAVNEASAAGKTTVVNSSNDSSANPEAEPLPGAAKNVKPSSEAPMVTVAVANRTAAPPADRTGQVARTATGTSGTSASAQATNGPRVQPDADGLLAALNQLPPPTAGQPATGLTQSPLEGQEDKPSSFTDRPAMAKPVQISKLEQAAALQNSSTVSAAGSRGQWSINLGSFSKQAIADAIRKQYREQGITADKVAASVNGKTYYRLRVAGFESRQAAITESLAIRKKLGLEETWVTRD